MKKLVGISPILFVFSSFGQNLIQTNISNNFQSQHIQTNQVFASNRLVNDNVSNKPVRAIAIAIGTNPQAIVQRVSNANTNQRQQRRVRREIGRASCRERV